MKSRKNPICPNCGGKIKGKYLDQSKRDPMHRLVGDTFLGWDYEGHVCLLGILYFIERTDTKYWFDGNSWTNDPMRAKPFRSFDLAANYLKMTLKISARLECVVTEHEFVNSQSPDTIK